MNNDFHFETGPIIHCPLKLDPGALKSHDLVFVVDDQGLFASLAFNGASSNPMQYTERRIMEKFSNEYFRKLANDLKFDLSDEEIEELKKDFVEVEKQVELFETIDTEGVEPMVYPFEAPTTFLREDVVADVLDQKDALENAPDVRMGHVHVPKVVK